MIEEVIMLFGERREEEMKTLLNSLSPLAAIQIIFELCKTYQQLMD
jgi:hypothetical protein